jgi:hypothetical protein
VRAEPNCARVRRCGSRGRQTASADTLIPKFAGEFIPSLQPTCYGLRPSHAAELKRLDCTTLTHRGGADEGQRRVSLRSDHVRR